MIREPSIGLAGWKAQSISHHGKVWLTLVTSNVYRRKVQCDPCCNDLLRAQKAAYRHRSCRPIGVDGETISFGDARKTRIRF